MLYKMLHHKLLFFLNLNKCLLKFYIVVVYVDNKVSRKKLINNLYNYNNLDYNINKNIKYPIMWSVNR